MAHPSPQRRAGRFVLSAIGLACALVPAAALRADEVQNAAIASTAELRIAEIRLRERQVLLSDVLIYEAADGVLLIPFDVLMEALDFRLAATPDGGIEGWFLRETQRLTVNRASRHVKVAGRELELLASDLVEIDGALHISSAALDRWLAMGVKWDGSSQGLTLAPPYLLAAEELARRQRGAGLAGAGRPAFDSTGFTPVSAPWAPIGWPVVNVNAAVTYDDRAGGVVVQANALAEGDLLWATGRLALVGSSQGNIDARLTLARQDPQSRLLGGVGASIVEAGDIAVPANPLLQRNAFGVGFRIGREPLGSVGEFDRTDLIGDAPPGWQAELYRDSELLGFQTIASDGRYFFPEVPVLFGLNRFRIVLYGPAGERQEIARTFDIGANLVRPGEFRYNLVAMKQGYSLFGGALDLNPLRPRDGLPDDPSPDRAAGGQFGFQQLASYIEARAAYGLTGDLGLSGFAAWRRLDADGSSIGYVGAGAITRVGSILTTLDAIVQDDGAAAGRASVTAGLGALGFTATHDRFGDGFLSEETGPERGGIASRTQAQVNGRIAGIGLGLGGALTELRSGGIDRNVNLRLNATITGFSIANSLLWREFRSQPGQPANERFDGQFTLSGGIGKVRLRGGIDYAMIPQVSARRLRGELSYRLKDWFLAASTDRDLENKAGQWGLVATRDWNGLRVGADLRYEDVRSEWRGLLTLSVSVDRDPLDHGLRFGRDAVGQRGTVLASGFRDSNGNGRRDPGEEMLGDVEIKVDPRGRVRRRNATIIAEELPLDRAIAVAPVLDGIDDPFLVATARGYLVTPRAGRPVRIAIPLVESGEVVLQLAGSSGGLVELISCTTGEVAARERAAFDGQAFFTGVLPGCYLLRIEERELKIEVQPGEVTRAEMSEAWP